MKTIAEELEILTRIPALSGLEDNMIREMVQRFTPLADQVDVDRIGNVTATFNGSDEANQPSLLVFAHMDELGMMVRKIESDGYLRFDRVGGVPEKTLMGQYVDVHTIDGKSHVVGQVGTYSHHFTPPEAKRSVPSYDQMYIDIGAASALEVEALGLRVGSAITYHPHFERIGQHLVSSKSIDNRVGCLMLIALAEALHSHPPLGRVYVVASVQEEFNIRGVMPAFYRLEPNAAICLDITPACDTPDLKGKYDLSLNGGPAITQMNFHGRGTLAGLIPNPHLRLFMENTLDEMGISWQRDISIGVITDDAFTLMSGQQGTAMAHISIPLRYSHSPSETCDVRDVEAGIQSLVTIVSKFDNNVDLRRGV